MKNWSTEKIVAVSLASSFVLVVIAADIVSVYNGSMEITAFGKEIAIGLFGYIGRGGVQAIDKRQAELDGKKLKEKSPDDNPPKKNHKKGAMQNEENRDSGNQP